MQPSIYGLQVDYITRNGHFMVLSAKEGLKREELSAFQLTMLLNNKIPKLLDLQVEELDQSVKLFYNISGKRKLNYVLRAEMISIKQMFELLYSIVEVLLESGNYMLQDGYYVLKEEYIYCGDHLTDLYLTYLPKQTLIDKHAIQVDLQHLLSRLVHKVTELQGSGYQEVMSYLMDDTFNLPTLKGILLKHMTQLGGEKKGKTIKSGQPTSSPEWNPEYLYSPGADPYGGGEAERIPVRQAVIYPDSTKYANTGEEMGDAVPSLKMKKEIGTSPAPDPLSLFHSFSLDESHSSVQAASPDEPVMKKRRLPAFLIGALSLCLIWRLYLEHSTESWLLICSGLTLLLGDLVYIVLFLWKTADKSKELAVSSVPGLSGSGVSEPVPVLDARLPVFPVNEATAASEAANTRLQARLNASVEPAHTATKSQEGSSYYHLIENRTTLLNEREATVLLKPASVSSASAFPYLLYKEQGTENKVILHKDIFVVGRGGQEVDFEHDEVGVSRMHMEIVREDGCFHVKDLGSRNGTYVNGELLVPYQMYSLKEGDIVKLITTEFQFKMGS
ncbi:DUF6382 domain-containing protein [Paenibacillus rigui]|uniref:FHA domain-containing protein n=1 Tax=Paenibacillus rigui TaxID=554312 RepID=A0A229UX02_9BACL|nr:DUF6382 domain-containing protein [Paenibacillus rigui]OXM87883.1 hypothetical protein CF651_01870 [Paenibacillus rigui]